MPADGSGACIYFVIDSAAQLILYIGETSTAQVSDTANTTVSTGPVSRLCITDTAKVSSQYGLLVDAPVQTKQRQHLEMSLIKQVAIAIQGKLGAVGKTIWLVDGIAVGKFHRPIKTGSQSWQGRRLKIPLGSARNQRLNG